MQGNNLSGSEDSHDVKWIHSSLISFRILKYMLVREIGSNDIGT